MSTPGNPPIPRIPYSAPARSIADVNEIIAAISDRIVNANAMNLGVNGAVGCGPADVVTGNFFALQAIGDTVIGTLTAVGDSGDVLTGVTLPSGMVVYGNFTAVTVTSGYIRAYKKQA